MAEFVPNYYDIPEITLSYKIGLRMSDRPSVTCVEDAHEIFRQVWDDNKLDLLEEGKVMLLNRANRVIGICNLSSGGITGTVMDTRHVFAAALKANACQIILAHNHPSDNPNPSNADRALTEKMKTVGECHDIKVVDHLIICRSGCYSVMSDETFSAPRTAVTTRPTPH